MSKWMITYDKLDADQKDFVKSQDVKNEWIVGFPGSGKSVLLVHKIKQILDCDPSASIDLVVFTRSLKELFRAGFRELGITGVGIQTMYEFYKDSERYDYIFCDEVQDITPEILEAIRRRAMKQVFVAGDPNQSIYKIDPRFKQPTVAPDEPGKILDARRISLRTIYRLTQSIMTAVQKFYTKMNLWQAKRDMTKQDVNIRLCKSGSISGQIEYINNRIAKILSEKESCVILLATRNDVKKFVDTLLELNGSSAWIVCDNIYGSPNYDILNDYLRVCGLKYVYVGGGYGSLDEVMDGNYAAIMTYASSKGLDFENVFMPFVSRDLYINADPEISKTQFMVAMTRCRKNLYLTYSGSPFCYVDQFAEDCSNIDCDRNVKSDTLSSTNIFGF